MLQDTCYGPTVAAGNIVNRQSLFMQDFNKPPISHRRQYTTKEAGQLKGIYGVKSGVIAFAGDRGVV